jgi:hypothetical protein
MIMGRGLSENGLTLALAGSQLQSKMFPGVPNAAPENRKRSLRFLTRSANPLGLLQKG